MDKQITFTPSDIHIAARIRFARTRHELSIDDLASRSGLPSSDLRELELAERSLTAVELHQLADALDLPLEWFLGESLLTDLCGEWRVLDCFRSLHVQQREAIIHLLLDVATGAIVTDHYSSH